MTIVFDFSIDRGGTFTDVYASWEDVAVKERGHRVMKLLSEDPKNYPDAPREGIRRILEEVTGVPIPRGALVPTGQIRSIRMGTTVATNALLERKGAPMALLVTKGFRDLLEIGNQARPLIFDIKAMKPDNLYEAVIEVDERIVLLKEGEELPVHKGACTVTGSTGETFVVEQEPDLEALSGQLRMLLDQGITSIAVAFLHAFAYPEHEQRVGKLATQLGFTQVSLSSDVMPMIKIVPRGYTAAADAYLSPHIKEYIRNFRAGFDADLDKNTQLHFMQSDGGLARADAFNGSRAILSGPAGGVVGYASTTYDAVGQRPCVAFDMGGTSTDVSRYAGGDYSHVFETTTAGVTIQAPQLDISTVAAGGGSRLFYQNGLFVVGPESAGAHPGPICYRKGGHLAVTDANLVLGRIPYEEFPHIFGPNENEPLDVEATWAAFERLTEEINASNDGPPKSVQEVAHGFIQVANEAMCRPIRALTQMRGFDITTHVLACFGGAGPQHACAIAKSLSVHSIFVARYSSILSAYGISLANVVTEAQAPVSTALLPVTAMGDEGDAFLAADEKYVPSGVTTDLAKRFFPLLQTAADELLGQGFSPTQVFFRLYVNTRYQGSDSNIMIPVGYPDTSSEEAVVTTQMVAEKKEEPGGEGEEEEEETFDVDAGIEIPYSEIFSVPALVDDNGKHIHTPLAAAATYLADLIRAVPHRYVQTFFREYSFTLPNRDIFADDIRVRGIAKSVTPPPVRLPKATESPVPRYIRDVYFEGGNRETPVFMLTDLLAGHRIVGPAMLLDQTNTVLVEPGFYAVITETGDIRIFFEGARNTPEALVDMQEFETLSETPLAGHDGRAVPGNKLNAVSGMPAAQDIPPDVPTGRPEDWRSNPLLLDLSSTYTKYPCDPIQLSIFAHRFMSIAEQMGRTLQRTSVSVNIRERLDFSCAIFSADGGLVANAPFIPVHLGAMAEAVRAQLGYWGANLKEGDVLVSNHPQLAGGSHLPDITAITPVFHKGKIVFFVASRGHHADIGGIAPGSMPPTSKSLIEEGAAIVAFKIVRDGVFQEQGITDLLMAPAKYGVPGCSGSRNLSDCLSDLKAQVAGNHRGIKLVKELIDEHGLERVHAYMKHIQDAAENAVRDMLVSFSLSRGLPEVGTVTATDHMDDGTPIRLSITIDRRRRSAIFDFEGTGDEVFANTNAPKAVTYSAVIYCLRCLVGLDIPLNQGCLNPVEIKIPKGSILDPSPTSAVVGGNVLTSQRVVDVVFKAFGASAASQGCMNNLTFGASEEQGKPFGYYETICGGAGAGPDWVGSSGVHTHMTNTRLGDPEIIERRYPIVLRQFTLRKDSGGAGRNKGGDGVAREIEFRRTLTVSILSERRTFRPYGLAGGQPGQRGVNTILRHFPEGVFESGEPYRSPNGKIITGGRRINLGGKATIEVYAGDRLRICTPGGGGYGSPEKNAPGAYGDDWMSTSERQRDDEDPGKDKDMDKDEGQYVATKQRVGVVHPKLAARATGSLHLLAEQQADF